MDTVKWYGFGFIVTQLGRSYPDNFQNIEIFKFSGFVETDLNEFEVMSKFAKSSYLVIIAGQNQCLQNIPCSIPRNKNFFKNFTLCMAIWGCSHETFLLLRFLYRKPIILRTKKINQGYNDTTFLKLKLLLLYLYFSFKTWFSDFLTW